MSAPSDPGPERTGNESVPADLPTEPATGTGELPTDPDDVAMETDERPARADERPLSRLAERFRIPLGILVALIGIGLAIVFATRPIGASAGARDWVEHIALVTLWVMIAAAGATWAIGLARRITNLCAVAGIAAYIVTWVAGL